jgi:hypothetical protein
MEDVRRKMEDGRCKKEDVFLMEDVRGKKLDVTIRNHVGFVYFMLFQRG